MAARDNIIAVYIMANQARGTIYTGATTDLSRRAFEHREGARHGFTKTYGLKHLVWYEIHDDIAEAFRREKAIKHYSRAWKIALIEATNPQWADLYDRLNG